MSEQPMRDEVIEELKVSLGHGMVDVELDPVHYNLALTRAVRRYRQRSSRASQEAFVFIDLVPEVSLYTLPDEVQDVRFCYRRSMAATGNAGNVFDPFGAAFVNNIYMVQNPGGMPGGGAGTLALYDFAMQHQELIGRMFGRDLQYTWNPATKKINFHRLIKAGEQVALHAYIAQPEEQLLKDPYARPWLEDYALAFCKLFLGEGRGKWTGGMAGPQGGVTLNGAELKQEAQAEFERLDTELRNGSDSQGGYTFVIG